MALAFDSVLNTSDHTGSPSSPVTDAFTNNAGNVVYVGIILRGVNSDLLTGVTYSGDALSLISKETTGGAGNNVTYVYYKSGAKTGANNISVSYSGSPTAVRVSAVSYSGANSTQPDTTIASFGTVGGGTKTVSITPVVSNCWSGLWFWNDESGTQTAGSGATLRGASLTDPAFFDSNGTVNPGASYSMAVTWTGSAANYESVIFSIAPATSSTGFMDLTSKMW